MLLSLVLMLVHQFTGASVLIINSITFLAAAGAEHDAEANLYAIFIGVTHFCGACIALIITDTLNRRPMLLGGVAAVAVIMATLGILMVVPSAPVEARISMIYAFILVYQAVTVSNPSPNAKFPTLTTLSLIDPDPDQATVAPMFSCIVTEIFPVHIRSAGISLIFATLFMVCFLMLSLYGATVQYIHERAWCFIFGLVALISFFLLLSESFLPETNGISLYEAENLWNRDRSGTGHTCRSSPDVDDEGPPATSKMDTMERHVEEDGELGEGVC